MSANIAQEKNWQSVCKVADIPRSSGRTIQYGNTGIAEEELILELAIFRLRDNSIKIIANHCPHKGGPLADGIVSAGDVLCPLHNWRVNLDNGNVAAPDSGCVRVYPVKVEGDVIFFMP